MKRQAILTRDDPPTAWFLVDEAAFRRRVGSPEVMAAQMAHLAAVAKLPKITIQVVPAIAHAGLRMCEEWKATGARAASQATTAEPA